MSWRKASRWLPRGRRHSQTETLPAHFEGSARSRVQEHSRIGRRVMDTDAVRHSVDEGNRKFGAAAARKDYAGIAALYTANAKVLPPDAPIVTGKKAIEEFWRSAATAL